MDFLRIPPDPEVPSGDAPDDPGEPDPAPQQAPALPAPFAGALAYDDRGRRDIQRLEDMLRAELDVPPAPGPPQLTRTTSTALLDVAYLDEPGDPLDEFFWNPDEIAPSLPDLVPASDIPVPEPFELRREWLTFRVGPEDYALEIEHVREVLKAPPLTEVPRAPAHILGVIMVRGEVIAVLDPRVLLGLPRGDAGPRARVLVCDTGEVVCGILVDSVSHVIRLAPSSIEPRPSGVGATTAEAIAGLGRERSRLFVLLDAVTLLADALPASAPGAAP